jgi:hypothetical protein
VDLQDRTITPPESGALAHKSLDAVATYLCDVPQLSTKRTRSAPAAGRGNDRGRKPGGAHRTRFPCAEFGFQPHDYSLGPISSLAPKWEKEHCLGDIGRYIAALRQEFTRSSGR